MGVERVVIINDMATARGGATALALLSAEMLRRRNIEVTFITGDSGDNGALAANGVEVLAAGGSELLQQNAAKSMVEGINNPKTRRLVADFIETRDTARTVYHVHGWSQILSPAIFAPLRKVAARTVVHCHDFFLACPNGVFFDFRKSLDCTRKPLGAACVVTNCDKRSYAHKGWRLLRHAVFRRVFDQSLPWAAIIMIHPDMAPQMIQADYPAGRLVTVRNPAPAFSQTRVRAEENRLFAFVGRVEPDKGVLELIAAAAQAKVALMIIGDGPLREPLAAQHPEVAFTGWKTRDEIGALVQTARALVMPTRFREPFGMVALEAAQSGLPVIVAQSALLAREVVENGLGFACDIHNRGAFAAALARVRDMDSGALRAISERGHSGGVQLCLSPDDWGDRLIALYDCATGGAR